MLMYLCLEIKHLTMFGDLKTSGNNKTVPQYLPFSSKSMVSDTVILSFSLKAYSAVDQSNQLNTSHSVADSSTFTSGDISIIYSFLRFAFLPQPIFLSGIK